jgi:uncharacterized membrane protein
MNTKLINALVAGALITTVFYALPTQLLIPEQMTSRWLLSSGMILAHLLCAYGLIRSIRLLEFGALILTLYVTVAAGNHFSVFYKDLGGDARIVSMLLPGVGLYLSLSVLLIISLVSRPRNTKPNNNKTGEQDVDGNPH